MEFEAKDRRKMLKIKLKSLAAEAKIIRMEEKKTKGWLRNELWEHRVKVVRSEARATLLAYAFIRGRSYEQTEPNAKTKPLWHRVESMVQKYGPVEATSIKKDLKAWYTVQKEAA